MSEMDYIRDLPEPQRMTLLRHMTNLINSIQYQFGLGPQEEVPVEDVEEDGLTEDEVNLLPTSTFSSQSQEAGDATWGDEQEIEQEIEQEVEQCQICLLDLEDGDTLRSIPCGHNFHSHCLDEWVKRHATCPLCRHDLRP